MDLICIGTPAVDIIYTPDGKATLLGGSQANTACVASKLGLRCGLLGYQGTDALGTQLAQDIQAFGVDTSLMRKTLVTRVNHIKVASSGDSSFLREESRISPIQLLRSEIEYLKQARAVFIQASNEVFEQVLRVCEKNNIPLFVTLQKEKAPRIDLLKSPIIKAVFANDDEITQEVLALEDKIVAVTYGAKGSVIRHKGREIVHDAFAVDAVDSTGAGDAFAGAFIYGHLSGWELAETARFSNFLGAVASTTFGSREALRNVSKEELLKSYASLPNPG